DRVYVCSEKSLFVIFNQKIEKEIKAQGSIFFTGLLEVYESLFVKAGDHDLLQLNNDQLINTEVPLPSASEIIFCSGNSKTGNLVIGTEAGSVFLMNPKSPATELKFNDAVFVRQSLLVAGVWINDSQIALGTLLGGVLLVDTNTGATIDHLDFNTGLPDNEVFAMMADHSGGVWVAHEYGFTRIAPSLPFKSYNHFPGLNGNLLCVQSIKDQIYVGTSTGLYRLTKEQLTESKSIQEIQNNQLRRKGLFSFWRKNATTTVSSKPTFEVKVIKQLGYSYKKVPGIEGKIIQLIEVNGKLIASGLAGVFEVGGDKTKSISNGPVKTIFFSSTLQQLLIGTSQHQVKTVLSGATGWNETHLLDTLADQISYIFEDNLDNIWLCGRTAVYRVETADGKITDATVFPISNPSLDETVGVAYGNEVYLAASEEFRIFDHKNSFVRYDSLPGPHRYFASAGYFWFNDGFKWRTVDRHLKSLNLQWLGLFPNLRFLAPADNAQNLWVITASNELYLFNNSLAPSEDVHYPLMLRQVKGQDINITKDKSVVLEQQENELSFDFIQPDYVGSHAMQYRYLVQGLSNAWTSWSSTNHIASFPFLPPGNYQLAIQSRDILGNESKIETFAFKILPPYWKRWWFYALEFVFFGILVFLSVKLTIANSKYRYLSEILSLLTVIIFIQFISTAISSIVTTESSPVIEFFIQVFIALLVFPIELYFRKFMRAVAEGKYQIRIKNNKSTNQ
ncbi:MAG: triple tyrosine motif-containing protein, partial [Cyclobacteriaceae bacterium]|nr:triple tyrosine motif-containing protein [Cyclobacteriaceae bacterium]